MPFSAPEIYQEYEEDKYKPTAEKKAAEALRYAQEQRTKNRELLGEISPAEAHELFKEEYFGPEAVEAAFDVRLEDHSIPPIPFTLEELQKAKELGQYLELRVNQDPDGSPLTGKRINEIIQPKLTAQNKGKLLLDTDRYKDEPFYTTDAQREPSWALTSKECLTNSKNQNYLQQSELLVSHLQEKILPNIPEGDPRHEIYTDALQEWEEFTKTKKPEIEAVFKDEARYNAEWPEIAKTLGNLKINQLLRPSFQEALYSHALRVTTTDTRLHKTDYVWTRDRASSGYLVDVGYGDSDGAYVGRWYPRYADPDTGVAVSRSA